MTVPVVVVAGVAVAVAGLVVVVAAVAAAVDDVVVVVAGESS